MFNGLWNIAKFESNKTNIGAMIDFKCFGNPYNWSTGCTNTNIFKTQYNDADKLTIDTNGNLTLIDQAISSTELGYLDGVTSNVQIRLIINKT